MSRFVISLAVAFALLAAWDGLATRHEESLRRSNLHLGRFISKQEREGRPVAGIRIQKGAEPAQLYGSMGGMWRCLSYHSAVASGDQIGSLVHQIFEAEGIVQSDKSAVEVEYGLNTSGAWSISLHGPGLLSDPQHDVLLSLDLGNATSDNEGCYIRRHGSNRIWSVDTNPHQELDHSSGNRLPPMLDPSLVPGAWLAQMKRMSRIEVEPASGESYVLEMHELKVTPEQMRQGMPAIEWHVKQGGSDVVSRAALDYALYLLRAPYRDVRDPAGYAGFGFDQPRARVTLHPESGQVLELRLAREKADGSDVVYNSFSRSIFEVDPNEEGLLFPPASTLLTRNPEDPWRVWLQLLEAQGR